MTVTSKLAKLTRQVRGNVEKSYPVTTRYHRLFWYKFSHEYVPELFFNEGILKDSTDVLHKRLHRSIRERPREYLWIRWAVSTSVSKKKVVRGYITRSLRVAWRKSVEAEGFDYIGKRIDEAKKFDLHGTLRVLVRDSLVESMHDKNTLRKQMAKMAQEVVKQCREREEERESEESVD